MKDDWGRYSLINVTGETNGKVKGYWIQDKHGTLKEVHEFAKGTEAVNGNKIRVAIVEPVNSTVPQLSFFEGLTEIHYTPEDETK